MTGTKDRIARAALGLFNGKGTKAVTTNHIAEAAGISPGNLYYHYRNKEEIIREIFSAMVKRIETESSYGRSFKIYPSIENLELFFQKVLAVHWEYRFFFRELNALLNRDRELKKAFSRRGKIWLREIEGSIRAFSMAGIFRYLDNGTTAFLARALWILGAFWHSYIEASGARVTAARIEQGIEMMRNLLRPYLGRSAVKQLDAEGAFKA